MIEFKASPDPFPSSSSRNLWRWPHSLVKNHRHSVIYSWLLASMLVLFACGDIRTGDAKLYGIAELKLPALPKTGSHAVLMFNEMHYQPSFRSQETPRLLPQPGAVPFHPIGTPNMVHELSSLDLQPRELQYESLEEYKKLTIPSEILNTYDSSKAKDLFRINCVVCHGANLTGDGNMAKIMREKNLAPLPADLTLPITQDSTTEGELFAFISYGGRQGYSMIERGKESTSPMPTFRLLLQEKDRWAIVKYILDQ